LARTDWHKKVHRLSLKTILGPLCPSLDVSLSVDEGSSAQPCLAPGDWITIDGKKLLARLDRADDEAAEKKELAVYGRQLRMLAGSDAKPFGRACIWGTAKYSSESHGCVTVGGLAAARLTGIGGVLLGTAHTIARDSAMPVVPAEELSAWATEQGLLLSEAPLNLADKMNAVAFILQCGGDPGDLPIVMRGTEYLNSAELRTLLAEEESITLFDGDDVEYDEDSDECHPKEFKEQFEKDESILYVRKYSPSILTIGGQPWPKSIIEAAYAGRPQTFEELIRNIVAEVWGDDIEESEDEKQVGTVYSEKIKRQVTTLLRQNSENESE